MALIGPVSSSPFSVTSARAGTAGERPTGAPLRTGLEILRPTFRGEKESMIKGFKDFILRGNVIDLAVAVVIGGAFTAVVTAIVDSIINPIVALFYRPFLFGPLGLILGLPGLVMGTRERRLSLAAIGAVGLFWLIGASIAIWYSNPLY